MFLYIDEAGRGPLAWPVTVWWIVPFGQFDFSKFKDSKICTEKLRDELFDEVKRSNNFWMSESVSAGMIDKNWIVRALRSAIMKIYRKISKKVPNLKKISKIFIDWPSDFGISKKLNVEIITIVDGDALIPEISAASIVAKVTRDKLMSKLHLSYPDYAFDKHKWYGTKFHRDKIIEIWPSKIHRISYLKNILNPEKNLKTKKTRKWT